MIEGYDYRISWVAPEYEHREHSADWYWALGIISVSLAVAFVIVGNMLLSVIILIGMGSLLFYAKHPPQIIKCELSKKGVRAGKTLYTWESLESFWVLDGYEDEKEIHNPKLLITSKKPLMPHIVIPLDELTMQEVHQAMAHMLHEEHQVEPLPDRLMRKIGF
ncbi:MAG: hypothetical protein HZB12_03720 [Candidatus Yonathbacteria bacterium]|nr:hypothetical protein [Candidatus Yonathbacteria bacterium]